MPYDRLIHVEPTADAALRWCERAARGEVPHGCHSGPGWPRVDASYMRGVSTHRPAPFRMRASIAPSLTQVAHTAAAVAVLAAAARFLLRHRRY